MKTKRTPKEWLEFAAQCAATIQATSFEHLLELLPSLRQERFITAEFLRRALRRAEKQCTWCARPCPKGRWKWCSSQCSNSFLAIADIDFQRQRIWYRDKSVCALCGTKDIGWEMDHVLPVVKGGGLCGLEGLRTLCRKCHKRVTAELNAELLMAAAV